MTNNRITHNKLRERGFKSRFSGANVISLNLLNYLRAVFLDIVKLESRDLGLDIQQGRSSTIYESNLRSHTYKINTYQQSSTYDRVPPS